MKFSLSWILFIGLFFFNSAFAVRYYNTTLCHNPNFTCIKVKKGDTWDKLFPDPEGQELVKKVNRINIQLIPGNVVAIPNNLKDLDMLKISPFARQIEPLGRTTIIIDISDHAFAAYDMTGTLVYWGPVSAGADWCPDVGRGCRTPLGNYYVITKDGPNCISTKYPIPEGGAPMPWCMFFHGGYAMHGSPVVPGYHASHGCIRLFYEDAEWLNKNFVHTGKNSTKVIVQQ